MTQLRGEVYGLSGRFFLETISDKFFVFLNARSRHSGTQLVPNARNKLFGIDERNAGLQVRMKENLR